MENADGTWSLWGEGGSKPLRTYTKGAEQTMMRQDAALRLEVGSTGKTLESMGFTKHESERAKELADRLRTGEPYGNVAEAQLGEGMVAEAEASGTLPAFGDVLGAAGSAAGGVVWGAGAAYVGVEIGNTIDRIVGLPELELGKLIFGEAPNTNCGGEHGPFCERFEEEQHWDSRARIVERAKTCSEYIASFGTVELGAPPESWLSDKCVIPNGFHLWHTDQTYSGGKHQVNDANEWYGTSGEDPRSLQEPCHPAEQFSTGFCVANYYDEHRGEDRMYLWDVSRAKARAQECKPHGGEHGGGVCYPKRSSFEPEFPSNHPSSNAGVEGTGGTVSPPAPAKVDVPKPSETSPKVVTYIVTEHPEEYPEAPPETEKEVEEKEKPVPSPLWPTLPKPEPNEVGTDYKSRIESDGFTNVEIKVLPETSVDPRVGPGEVSAVDPKPDNPYDPSTKVTVVVNPEVAGPGVPSPGIPPINIGGVTEPELKPPHLNVLCENFPFGVPCWIVEELNSWSAVGAAPTLGISSFDIKGHTIGGGSISLSHIEPIMEKVRPFMIVFGTVGLVLLFYGFAMGGNPGSGSSSSSGGSGSEDGEDDA